MYYHIVITEKTNQAKPEYKTDLTKEQLISKFIEPYEEGATIVINGKAIPPNFIDRVKITASPKTIESYIAEIKHNDQNSGFSIAQVRPYPLRAIDKAEDITDEYIGGAPGFNNSSSKDKSASANKIPNKNKPARKVFIVHGHDEAAQSKVARFIEKIDYEPIILHEQASEGRTIIEKIEKFSDVGFAIILYTPDDLGNQKSKADELNLRARQNVIFEHGYLIGKLGRNKVATLIQGDIERPNDISGVVYINFDEANAWYLTLAKEMVLCGYDIDMNKLLY